MLIRKLNLRYNIIVGTAVVVLFYYLFVVQLKYKEPPSLLLKDVDLNVSKLLGSLKSSSSNANCDIFWNAVRQIKLPHYDDSHYHHEKSDEITKQKVFWEIQNQTSLVRSYHHCFINEDRCDLELEKKLYPWFSFNSPTVTGTKGSKPLFKFNCLNDIKKQLKGKGIVMSASEFHLKELVYLFALLRALDTTLPIQIIHRGDLTEFSQKSLIKVAEVDISDSVKKNIDVGEYNGAYPKLNIAFVDISNTINPGYEDKFKRFSNKLLAYLFNSFQEVILMDVDSVPLVALESFFQLEEYKSSGAFFFKDRSLHAGHSQKDTVQFFASLLPTTLENEKLGIQKVTDITLQNPYFKGFANLMESGMVIIDRSKHFTNPMMALSLSMWNNAIMSRVWGDKELYWLALSISGDENYQFNKHHAGSIGEISPTSNSHYPDQPNLKELCSSHPAHIYKDNTLLWMNTGFKYCKKIIHSDPSNPFFRGWAQEEVDRFNSAPLKIRQVLIPPIPDKPGDSFWKGETSSPVFGWESLPYCESYTLCAYDRLYTDVGTVIEISDEKQKWYDFLGEIYTNGMQILVSVTKKEDGVAL